MSVQFGGSTSLVIMIPQESGDLFVKSISFHPEDVSYTSIPEESFRFQGINAANTYREELKHINRDMYSASKIVEIQLPPTKLF